MISHAVVLIICAQLSFSFFLASGGQFVRNRDEKEEWGRGWTSTESDNIYPTHKYTLQTGHRQAAATV